MGSEIAFPAKDCEGVPPPGIHHPLEIAFSGLGAPILGPHMCAPPYGAPPHGPPICPPPPRRNPQYGGPKPGNAISSGWWVSGGVEKNFLRNFFNLYPTKLLFRGWGDEFIRLYRGGRCVLSQNLGLYSLAWHSGQNQIFLPGVLRHPFVRRVEIEQYLPQETGRLFSKLAQWSMSVLPHLCNPPHIIVWPPASTL